MRPVSKRTRRLGDAATLLALLAAAATPAFGQQHGGWFQASESLYVEAGETRTGDSYFTGNSIEVAGKIDGDLVAFGNMVQVTGEITGDLITAGQTMTIGGNIGDSVRIFGQTVTVNGRIEGDLLVFAAVIQVSPGAHITGNVRFFGGKAVINGTVDGDLSGTGGELKLDGTIGGDARLKLDVVKLGERARIGGDLSYSARKEIDPASAGGVAGAIEFEPQKIKEDEPEPFLTAGDVMWWLWHVTSTVVLGALLLAFLRKQVVVISDTVATDSLMGGLIGFAFFVMTPVAAIIAMLLVITLPLGFIALLVYVATLIVAKIPVAVWLGRRLLVAAGRAAPSPFLGLTLGTVMLYLLFELPIIGGFLWLVALWLGIGAIVLGLRKYVIAGTAPAAPGGGAAPLVVDTGGPPDP